MPYLPVLGFGELIRCDPVRIIPIDISVLSIDVSRCQFLITYNTLQLFEQLGISKTHFYQKVHSFSETVLSCIGRFLFSIY